MGLIYAPDIFQAKMTRLMIGIEYIKMYLDDLLVLSCSSIEDHLQWIEQVLKRLKSENLKVHVEKSKFCATEVEYMGYLINREGIKPQLRKVQEILDLEVPTTV